MPYRTARRAGSEINLTTSLMNIEARLFITERDKEVGHQPPEEIAAPVVVVFQYPNLSGVRQ